MYNGFWGTPTSITDSAGRLWQFQIVNSSPKKAQYRCAVPSDPPTVQIDTPANNATVSGVITVGGWAIDNTARVETAVTGVRVYVDGASFIGNAAYGANRPDVCAAYPGRVGCPNVGYNISWNTTSVANGLHTIRVDATDSDAVPKTGSSPTITVNVNNTLTVDLTAATDSASWQQALSGTAPLNGVDLRAAVAGTASGTINYTFYCNRADAGTNVTAGWNSKLDNTNTNPYSVNNVCNFAAAGVYTLKVIAERGGLAAEDRVTVTVNAPPPPVLSVNPLSFSFSAYAGAVNPAAQVLRITNTGPVGSTPLNWNVSDNQPWLTVNRAGASPTSGSESGGGGTATPPLDVAVNIAGLNAGVRNATIAVTSNGGNRNVPVTLTILAAPQPQVSATITAVDNNPNFDLSEITDGDNITFEVNFRNVGTVVATRVNVNLGFSANLVYNNGTFQCHSINCGPASYNAGTRTLTFATAGNLNPNNTFRADFDATVNMVSTQSREFIGVRATGTYEPGFIPFSVRYSLLVSPLELIYPQFREISP